jgi:hypothetical protein
MNSLIKKLSLDLMQSNVITEESSILDTTMVKENSICHYSFPLDFSNTSFINADEHLSFPKAFTFKFVSGYTINIRLKDGLNYCPSLKENVCYNTDVIEVILPPWIKEEDLSMYFIYLEKGHRLWNVDLALNLIKIAEYFINEKAISELILLDIIPLINEDNCLMIIEDSFIKSKLNPIREWFELSNGCIIVISKNLPFFLQNFNNRMTNFSPELIDEIIEKYFYLNLDFCILNKIKN